MMIPAPAQNVVIEAKEQKNTGEKKSSSYCAFLMDLNHKESKENSLKSEIGSNTLSEPVSKVPVIPIIPDA